ncbi:MAG: hypothetical protein KKB38_20605, partial [Gammaproteobacteria bacterium]|nr:hypothetical protein [Gammaproteobacteria bacterium]
MPIITMENILDPKLVGYIKPNPAKPEIDFDNLDFESKAPANPMDVRQEAKPSDFANIDFETPDEPVQGPSISTFRPEEKGVFGKVWDEVSQFTKDTSAENAKSQNAYNMAESLGIGYKEAYDNLSTLSKTIVPRDQPTFQDLVEGTMMAGVTAGLVTHPVGVLLGVGTFMALNEVENAAIAKFTDRKYQAGAGLGAADVLPSDTRQEIKDLVWLADTSWKAIVSGGLAKKATPGVQNLYTRFVREVSETQGFPKSVYVSPEVFESFRGKGSGEYQGSRTGSQVESEILKHVNLTRDQVKLARDQGIDIEIPASKIVTMVDKPWWSAAKKMFGIEPFRSAQLVPGGDPSITPHMLRLPPPLEGVPKPTGAAKVRPVGVAPEFTFTSKKGRVYEKVGDYWYNERGDVVTHKFALKRIEEMKKAPEGVVAVSPKGVEKVEGKVEKSIVEEVIDETTGDEYYDYKLEELGYDEKDIQGMGRGQKLLIVDQEISKTPLDPKKDRLRKLQAAVERAKRKRVEGKAIDVVPALQEKVQSDYPNVPFKFSAIYYPDGTQGISLDTIKIPKDLRRQGEGTKILDQIRQAADQNNLRIETSPVVDAAGFFDRQIDFVKREDGRYIREPKVKVTEKEAEPEFELPQPERGGHPFRNSNLSSTQQLRDTYLERVNNIVSDPDLMVGKLINDVNLWLNGEKVPIDKVRLGLDELSRRADELVNEFGRPEAFRNFKAVVGEAAKWAREAGRPKEKTISYIQELRAQYNELVAANASEDAFSHIYRGSGESIRSLPRKGETWRQRADRVISELEQKDRLNLKRTDGGTQLNMEIDIAEAVRQAKKFLYGNRVVTLTGREKQSGPHKMLQYFAEWTKEDNIEFKKAWGGKERPSEDKGQYGYAPETALKPIDKGGTQLNMMIPVNELPEVVKGLMKNIKVGLKNLSKDPAQPY